VGHTAAAAAALQTAAAAAQAHAPLLGQVRKLAERAHIPIQAPPASHPTTEPAAAPRRYGLTSREAAVLRLLAAGRGPVSSAVAASTSEAHFYSYAHFQGHVFGARPQAHFVQHVFTRWA
jgi:hypothetical protein